MGVVPWRAESRRCTRRIGLLTIFSFLYAVFVLSRHTPADTPGYLRRAQAVVNGAAADLRMTLGQAGAVAAAAAERAQKRVMDAAQNARDDTGSWGAWGWSALAGGGEAAKDAGRKARDFSDATGAMEREAHESGARKAKVVPEKVEAATGSVNNPSKDISRTGTPSSPSSGKPATNVKQGSNAAAIQAEGRTNYARAKEDVKPNNTSNIPKVTASSLPPLSIDHYCGSLEDCANPGWTSESAARCARERCFSSSNWTQSVLRNGLKKATYFEDALANASTGAWGWPGKQDVKRRLIDRYRGKRCAVVGGAPFSTDPTTRSRKIDESGVTIRVNLAMPFSKQASRGRLLPATDATGDAGKGIGTKTDVLILNWIALKDAKCFTDLDSQVLKRHLAGATMFILLHEVEHIQLFLHCRRRLRESGSDIFLVPIHPEVRLVDTRAMQRTLSRFSESKRKELFPGSRHKGSIPFATSGLSAVSVALRLCQSVRTFGLHGDTHHTLNNVTYNPTNFHALSVERLVLQLVRKCEAMREGGLCRRLVDLN